MIDDIDVLDEEQVESPEQQDEPITTLPEHAGGEKKDRQDIIDETMDEGVREASAEAVIDELSDTNAHPELTVEDLRKIPGAEDMTDAEIRTEWNKAVATAQGGQTAQTDAAGQAT